MIFKKWDRVRITEDKQKIESEFLDESLAGKIVTIWEKRQKDGSYLAKQTPYVLHESCLTLVSRAKKVIRKKRVKPASVKK